jgi:hypothetical protein
MMKEFLICSVFTDSFEVQKIIEACLPQSKDSEMEKNVSALTEIESVLVESFSEYGLTRSVFFDCVHSVARFFHHI